VPECLVQRVEDRRQEVVAAEIQPGQIQHAQDTEYHEEHACNGGRVLERADDAAADGRTQDVAQQVDREDRAENERERADRADGMNDAAHPEQLVPDTDRPAQEETQRQKRKAATVAVIRTHLCGCERRIRFDLAAAGRDSIYHVAAQSH